MIKKELIIETDIELEKDYGYYITPINNKLCISRAKLPHRKPSGRYKDREGKAICYGDWKLLFHSKWKENRRKEYEQKVGGYKYGYSPNHIEGGNNNGTENNNTTESITTTDAEHTS